MSKNGEHWLGDDVAPRKARGPPANPDWADRPRLTATPCVRPSRYAPLWERQWHGRAAKLLGWSGMNSYRPLVISFKTTVDMMESPPRPMPTPTKQARTGIGLLKSSEKRQTLAY